MKKKNLEVVPSGISWKCVSKDDKIYVLKGTATLYLPVKWENWQVKKAPNISFLSLNEESKKWKLSNSL